MATNITETPQENLPEKKPPLASRFGKKIIGFFRGIPRFIKSWKIGTKVFVSVLLFLILFGVVSNAFLPSYDELYQNGSDKMLEQLEKEEDSSYKTVAVTYNSLAYVNLMLFDKRGWESEAYIGFFGQVYEVDPDSPLPNLINYTHRMLAIDRSIVFGAKLTIFLTVTSVFSGIILSVFLALGKISKFKPISAVCSGYIFFFRGTPLMIQLLCIYLAVPPIFGFAWRDFFPNAGSESVFYGALLAAFISFTLNTGAYCAEVVRAAIQSIDKGQFEAGKALGMRYGKVMSKIVLPQSVRRLIPPLSNEFIMVLKDASLVCIIGLHDITTISKVIASDGSYLVFVPAMAIYLVITGIFTMLFGKLEKKFSIYE